jgi:hypothetical protein
VARKKKKSAARKPAPMRWEFAPDIPTDDFLEDGPLDDAWQLQQAVENFVFWLEEDRFLTWEAVVCEEQGLPLTARQKKALRSLISFNDEEDDQILYINEIPRPSEPWYDILNQIAPHLLIESFKTSGVLDEVYREGWDQIMTALEEHGEGLSLPPGVASYREVVPADLRHKLWLQYCGSPLMGLCQSESLTLADPEQHSRIDWCVDNLRKCKESVAYLDLTLESFLTRVILPETDQPIFVRLMQEKLGLSSAQERIADHL